MIAKINRFLFCHFVLVKRPIYSTSYKNLDFGRSRDDMWISKLLVQLLWNCLLYSLFNFLCKYFCRRSSRFRLSNNNGNPRPPGILAEWQHKYWLSAENNLLKDKFWLHKNFHLSDVRSANTCILWSSFVVNQIFVILPLHCFLLRKWVGLNFKLIMWWLLTRIAMLCCVVLRCFVLCCVVLCVWQAFRYDPNSTVPPNLKLWIFFLEN